ncbi:MAG: RNA polymerase factor sigma-54 [Myxococcota bacterium]|nr:RNA polymerase factor sigma-54 [Myxococcota bacterium]
MALELRQNLKLSQQLVITPQLQQAIKLLQLSHMDLVEQIQQELVENPVLEEVPGGIQDDALADFQAKLNEDTRKSDKEEREVNAGEAMETNWAGLDESAPKTKENAVPEDAPERDQKLTEEQWREVLESYSSYSGTSSGIRGAEDLPPIEATLSTSQTLVEHLAWQLQMQHCTDGERQAAQVMLLNLDDRGYLSLTLEEVAQEAEVDLDDVEGAQMILQGLEPIGCGSRTLAECLVVQAKARFAEDPFFPQLISEHLADFERRNYQAIARAMDMDMEDVLEYHKMLQDFEPWPGRGYSDADPRYITPDVYVFKVGDEWQILQNEDGLPKLRVSPYYQRVMEGGGSKEEREYIKGKLDSADFLIKSIYKRQATIHKVVEAILKRQQDFFEHGVSHLRPMILRDIADEIGVHESTVSRVTSNKYLQCPQGIFELKYFFNAGIQQVQGEDIAAEAVKSRIKQIIAGEDPRKPKSDSRIATELREYNIKCARRTVAKYREAMGILSSSKRKSLF